MAPLQGVREEGVRLLGVGGDDARHRKSRHSLTQGGEPFGGRTIEKILAVQVEDIEEKRRQRQLAAQAGDVKLAAEAAHGELEGQGRAAWPQRHYLAVEDHLARR